MSLALSQLNDREIPPDMGNITPTSARRALFRSPSVAKRYFVTSGKAVVKCEFMILDVTRLAKAAHKLLREDPGESATAYLLAIYSAAAQARHLLSELLLARGSAVLHGTEWRDHHLLCRGTNPTLDATKHMFDRPFVWLPICMTLR